MKLAIVSMFSVASLIIAAPAFSSQESMALLKDNNCLGCHNIEGQKVGPSYMDIAKKYKGVANATTLLENKVAQGGAGVWGTMPMPANSPRIKGKDIKIMVAYILSLAK